MFPILLEQNFFYQDNKQLIKSQTKPIRYSYFRSSCSYRVRIALNWKQIPYDYVAVNLVQKEQFSESYSAKNPLHEVPALEIDGHLLTQSHAIIEYLEETRSSEEQAPPLLPKDPFQRAQVRQVVNAIGAIQTVQNLKILNKYAADAANQSSSTVDERKKHWANHWITTYFSSLEKLLSMTSSGAGLYCVGDQVTMADLFLVPQVYNARRWGVDMSAFPLIEAIDKRLCGLPAFQKAHPDVQPDSPK